MMISPVRLNASKPARIRSMFSCNIALQYLRWAARPTGPRLPGVVALPLLGRFRFRVKAGAGRSCCEWLKAPLGQEAALRIESGAAGILRADAGTVIDRGWRNSL